MKHLIGMTLGLALILGGSAFAEMKCVVPPSVTSPVISVEFADTGLVEISLHGHSRNIYQAIYKHNSQTYGEYVKIADQSTWKDMPKIFYISWYLRKDAPGDFFRVSGLPGLDYLEFSEFAHCQAT